MPLNSVTASVVNVKLASSSTTKRTPVNMNAWWPGMAEKVGRVKACEADGRIRGDGDTRRSSCRFSI